MERELVRFAFTRHFWDRYRRYPCTTRGTMMRTIGMMGPGGAPCTCPLCRIPSLSRELLGAERRWARLREDSAEVSDKYGDRAKVAPAPVSPVAPAAAVEGAQTGSRAPELSNVERTRALRNLRNVLAGGFVRWTTEPRQAAEAAAAARLALDRPDIMYASKGWCRGMARPTKGISDNFGDLGVTSKENLGW